MSDQPTSVEPPDPFIKWVDRLTLIIGLATGLIGFYIGYLAWSK